MSSPWNEPPLGSEFAAVLDRLARREMESPDAAAAVAATLDGASAVLVLTAADASRFERVRSALGGTVR